MKIQFLCLFGAVMTCYLISKQLSAMQNSFFLLILSTRLQWAGIRESYVQLMVGFIGGLTTKVLYCSFGLLAAAKGDLTHRNSVLSNFVKLNLKSHDRVT